MLVISRWLNYLPNTGVKIESRNKAIEMDDYDKSDRGVYRQVKKETKKEISQVEHVNSWNLILGAY